MGLIMEQSDRKEALRWYEAAAAQGYPAAIERLEQLRAKPVRRWSLSDASQAQTPAARAARCPRQLRGHVVEMR